MIRNDSVMGFPRPIGIIARCISAGFDQRAHQIRIIIIMLALQQRRNPLKPHPGINRLLIQRRHRSIFELFILHEDQVPDLDKTVTVFFGAARRSSPNMIAMIVKNLSARSTGARGTHHPKIIIRGNSDDPIIA